MDKTEFSTPSRLIILGNGFDLQAGLKSSFNDYYDSLNSDILGELELELGKINTSAEFNQFIKALKMSITSPSDFSNVLSILTLRRNTGLTFWDYVLFFEHIDNNNIGWADVEKDIQVFLENDVNKLLTLKSKLSGYDSPSFDATNKRTTFLFYVMVYVFELMPSQGQETELNQFLISELNRFENKFAEFLDKQTHNQGSNFNYGYEEKAAKILKALGRNECSNILSFNYTTPVSIKNNQRLQMKIRNVHGDLNSHIIIGIDQSSAKDNKNNYLFTKTYRIMELANDKKENHSLDSNIKSIIFYGHSLNDADYSYFLSIFDYYNLYDSDITLIFYYSLYPPKIEDNLTDNQNKQIIAEHNDKLKKIQYDRILSLINKYGSTLSNDHGDNLLHKLLLEDRLIIKELKLLI